MRSRARRVAAPVLGAALLLAGCSHGHTPPAAVHLHGFITWNGISLLGQGGFTQSGAQTECDQSSQTDRFGQVVVMANGRTLAAASYIVSDVQAGQPPSWVGSQNYVCAMAWQADVAGRQPAYTIRYDGHDTVVNDSDRDAAVTLPP